MQTKLSGESDVMWFHGVAGNIVLVAHTKKSPDAVTWTAMCAAMDHLLGVAGTVRTCVFTDGGGPSGAQRSEVARVASSRKQRISVISSAASVRFIASSIALFNSTIKTFSPAEWRRSLEHLAASAAEIEQIERALRTLVDGPNGARFVTVANAIKGKERR